MNHYNQWCNYVRSEATVCLVKLPSNLNENFQFGANSSQISQCFQNLRPKKKEFK